ncbi:unnamed protein product [Nezara viridula]|uniref:Uncharacterized protein n=1 Tax=Nezara viridula TaxID=85310 RepID=A0A9P0HH39_NEZVI|nr:unnamed protein product [Nezara viridula]
MGKNRPTKVSLIRWLLEKKGETLVFT